MRSIRKLIGTLALGAGSLVAVGGAQATVPISAPPDSPVPYVAWVGEHLQIAACAPFGKTLNPGSSVVFQLEDWSGTIGLQPFPIIESGITTAYPASSGALGAAIGGREKGITAPLAGQRQCVVQEWASLKPGIARFKVYQTTQTPQGNTSVLSSSPVIVRAIWMKFDGINITHGDGTVAQKVVPAGDTKIIWHGRNPSSSITSNQGDTSVLGTALYPGDGSKYYDPSPNRYRVKAVVKGAFPIGQNYAGWHNDYGLFDAPSADGITYVHLPAQWPDLARAISNDYGLPDTSAFDIHDDNVNTSPDLFYTGGWCPSLVLANQSATSDTVQSCGTPADALASQYSRTWAASTGPGAEGGPYDTLYGPAYLPDGKVDSFDTPMPAARVDFAISLNTGGATDKTGIGYLTDVRKQDVYVRRDPVTQKLLPNPFYAPFYSQSIPASLTAASDFSGVTGSQVKDVTTPDNTSIGWLPFGLGKNYENWQRGAGWLRPAALTGPSQCVLDGLTRLGGGDLEVKSLLSLANFRPKPYNEYRLAVYSDEHGEAQAAFVPGVGAYYDAFGVKNSNGGCDLQDDNGLPFDLGTADVKATAFYPYQPGEALGPQTAGPVSFRVTSNFRKLLNYYPKGPSKQDQNIRIVVAHAQDVDGSPLSGEVVCFMADKNAEGMWAYRNPLGIAIKGGATWLSPAADLVVKSFTIQDPFGLGRICGRTDQNGNIAVEVANSNGTPVDVMADFADEGLFRDRFVDFSKPGTSGTNIAGSTTPSDAQVSNISAISNTGSVVKTKAAVVKRAKKAIRTARIASASVKAGRLVVRVNGTATTVRIRIAITNSKGKTHVVIRTVAVNKNVTVKKVRISKKTGRVSVAVLAG